MLRQDLLEEFDQFIEAVAVERVKFELLLDQHLFQVDDRILGHGKIRLTRDGSDLSLKVVLSGKRYLVICS